MNLNRINYFLEKRGLKILQTFLVDIPFWPDIDKPPEELVGDFLPFLKKWLKERAKNRYKSTGQRFDSLPYFSKNIDFEKLMNRLSIIERKFPHFIQILFAHHNGVIAEKI